MTIVTAHYRTNPALRNDWKRPALWIVLSGFAIAVGPVARAADVAEGHRLAKSVCSRCHGITAHKKG
jgi:mono/diheme cytochrome c family protein